MKEPVSFHEFSYIFKQGFIAGADELTDPNASGAYVWEARLPGEYARYLETFKNDSVLPLISGSLPDIHPDTEADGYVFCGKCGKMK